MKATIFALPLLMVLSACSSPGGSHEHDGSFGDWPERTASGDRNDESTPYDRRILARMSRELRVLHEDGEAIPLGELREGLERRRAERTVAWEALPDAGAPEARLSPPELHDRARQSVVVFGKRYRCDKCTKWHLSCATGVAVAADGIVATAHHVLDDEEGAVFGVMTEDGVVRPVVEILAADPRTDVALVRVDGPALTPLPVRPEIEVGAPVWVLSHPARTFWYFSQGIVGRRFLRPVRGGDPIELLDISADFARGSSGGPVIDATGSVVGLVRATRSIYYTEEDDVQRDLQMVLKHCAPARALRDLTPDDE